MKILNVQQGTPEWMEVRAKYFTASEAPAMMGASKYKTRQDLLREKATGIVPDVNAATQARFDAGHAAEEKARVLISEIMGELYPVTCTNEIEGLQLLASMDGLTMDESAGWEHKLWNENLVASIGDDELDANYYWQLEHQLLVTGAEHILFTVSDGTPINTLSTEYRSIPARRFALIQGWKQFAIDLANYQHVEVAAKPTGKAPDALPALRIEVTGIVTASNISEFKAAAMAVFQGIKTDLQTDEDFADAEKTAKYCGEVEKKLAAAKEHALSQTASIDELFKAIDAIANEARRVRLDLEKQVKAQKENLRAAIINEGKAKLAEHIAALNNRISKPYMPAINADFAGAMKGKKTIKSLRDAVEHELTRAKLEANEIADRIQINMNSLVSLASEHKSLFPDTAMIVQKNNDDLVALIKSRIADHNEALQRKQEAAMAFAAAESMPHVHSGVMARPDQLKADVVQAVQKTSPALDKLAEPYMPDFDEFWLTLHAQLLVEVFNNSGDIESVKNIARDAYIYGYNTGYKHARDDEAA